MAAIKKVLILGVSGMLGSTVYSYLKPSTNFIVKGTARRDSELLSDKDLYKFDALCNIEEQLNCISKEFTPDYVINCIGIINKYCSGDNPKQINNAIVINAAFPYKLSSYFFKYYLEAKIIQIATDCVYSGKVGEYIESSLHDAQDIYGKTKSLGEVKADNLLNIRSSIIGLEKKNKTSLLEWFLGHKNGDTVYGYTNHIWNGITTLQFAELCVKIIEESLFVEMRELNNVIHYCPNKKLSKYNLLLIFQKVFNTNFNIIPCQAGQAKDMTLKSTFIQYEQKNMEEAINNYYLFINNN